MCLSKYAKPHFKLQISLVNHMTMLTSHATESKVCVGASINQDVHTNHGLHTHTHTHTYMYINLGCIYKTLCCVSVFKIHMYIAIWK